MTWLKIRSIRRRPSIGFPATCRIAARGFQSTRQIQFEWITVVGPAHEALEAVKATTGAPWYIVIPGVTFALRTMFTLPFSVMNRYRMRTQAEIQPLLSAMGPIIKARLASSAAARQGTLTREQIDVLTAKEKRRQRVKLFRKFKCQTWKSLIFLPTVQIPLWVTMSLTVRSMCGWSAIKGIGIEPGFATDGFLWYANLVQADPYSVLPLAIGAVGLANVEWNALNALNPNAQRKVSTAEMASKGTINLPSIISNLSRAGVVIFMSVALQAPTAVCLYWFSSNTYSLLQNLVLDSLLPIRQIPEPNEVSASVMELDNPKQMQTSRNDSS